MNQEQIETARSIAPTVPQSQAAADKTPYIVIQYVPDLGTGGSSASIAYVSDSSMTFLVDSAAPAGADAIGASGVILTSSSTYDTLGEIVDYINGRQAWRAYLVAALRSDATSILIAKSATKIPATGLTFWGDTSQNEGSIVSGTAAANEIVGAAISGEKFVNNGINGHVKDYDDGCENSLLYAEVQLTFTGVTNSLRIFSGKAGDAEVLIYNQSLTSTTEQDLGRTGTVQADGLNSVFLKAPLGHRLIIRAAAATAFSAYTKFNILGRTAVLSGSRIVDSINFTA